MDNLTVNSNPASAFCQHWILLPDLPARCTQWAREARPGATRSALSQRTLLQNLLRLSRLTSSPSPFSIDSSHLP